MKTIFVKLSAIALKASFALFILAAAPAFAQEAVGDWTGLLAGQLHIIVHITKSTDGPYSGSLESPDQGIHRVRDRLISRRTAVINQMRAFLLERGMVFAQRPAHLKAAMADILENAEGDLTPQMRSLVNML